MKTVPRCKLLSLWFIITCISCIPIAASAQGKILTKNSASKQIKSPNGKRVGLFSEPLNGRDRNINYWGKITVYQVEGRGLKELDIQPLYETSNAEAFLADSRDVQWSPDGRYLVVWKIDNLNSDSEKQTVDFIDVCVGMWEGFRGTRWATSDNFVGWKEGEPHTMLLVSERGNIEAQPINKPEPNACE
ncbi:hypothetical protein [Geobacter sp.]|uniref:hypothetical protein n=1 Tax=Geobacter sp. TaxID=46610 RepID=UPI001ACC4E5B|nr:hypothetical protein [Geobacter sp.]CAG0966474.1 hypothetical protein ANAEL_00935 [Anaerolineales bacterium]